MGIRKQYLQQQLLLLQNTKQQQIEKCSYYQHDIKQEQHLAAELEHHRNIQQSNQRIQKQRQKQKQKPKEKQKLEKEKSFQQAWQKFPHEHMQQQYTIEQQQKQLEQKDYVENQKQYGTEEQQLYCKQYDALYNNHKIYKASKTNNANTTIAPSTTLPPPTTTTTTKQKQLYHKWRSYANVAIKISYFLHKILSTTTAQQLANYSKTPTTTAAKTNTLKHSANKSVVVHSQYIKNKLFAFLFLLLITVLCIPTTTTTIATITQPKTITFETAAASTSALSVFATCSTTSFTLSTSSKTTTTTKMAMLLLYLTTSATYVSGAIAGRLTSSISASTSTIATRFQQAASTSLLPFHIGYDELTDTLNDNTVAVEVPENVAANSNEQQLLKLYKRAQQLQQKQQQHHTHHYPIEDFDEMPISIADVVSTLSPADVHVRRRASKRAAPLTITTTTTSTPNVPMSAASLTALSLTASTTATTTTAATKEKCEPKVLDEVPTEPVSNANVCFTFHINYISNKTNFKELQFA